MEKARVGKSACDCGAFIWDRTLQTRAPSPLKTSLTGHGIAVQGRVAKQQSFCLFLFSQIARAMGILRAQ